MISGKQRELSGTSSSLRAEVEGVLLVNLATVAWSTNAVLGRWLRADIGPVTLTALRFIVATAVFVLLARTLPPEERRYGKDWGWVVAMALSGVVAFGPLLYLGLRYSSAVNCSLIQGFSPLVTSLIAGWIIHEPVTRRETIGAVLGLCGMIGLISGGSLTFLLQLQFNPGDLILMAAAVIWAFYSVFGRRVMRTRSPVAATALSNLLGLPILVVGAAVELAYVPVNLNPATIAAIIHICVVPTIVGYWAWNRAVRVLGAGGAMVFYNTLALYGAVMGAVFLGEPLGPTQLVFGGLIVAGGLWGTLGGSGTRSGNGRR
jgi:drug/metabolite transporter (DMT)-like permease